MTTPSDPTTSVRDAVRSLDTRLDDVRREQAWRTIDRSLDDRPAPLPTRAWRLPVFALATLAVVIALIVAPRPARRPSTSTPVAGSGAPTDATTLSAAAGQRTVFDRDGVTLTLTGPGSVTVTREVTVLRVSVTKGLLVADRTTTAPPLAVDAGDNHVVSRDARFAVRVEPTMVVLGAGEQARQIVERHAIEMGALPLAPSGSNASTDGANTTGGANAPSGGSNAPSGGSNSMASSATASNTTAPNATANTTASSGTASNTTASNTTASNTTASNTTASNTTASNPTASNTTASRAPSRATTAERRAPVLPDIQMDAAELYKRAEAALAVRDPAGARELLERLLHDYPTDARVDAARYDLALIARSFGQHKRAVELLDVLITTGTDENLKTAARRLRPTLAP